LEAEDTDKYLSTLMKELHRHTEQHREPLSDQAMIQLHLSRTQQLQGPGQGPEEEGEAEDNRIMMTLWEMKEQFRRDFPSAPMPSDAALKQRYKILGLVRTAKSSFTSQNDSFSNVVQGSNSKSMDHLSALNPSSSYSDRVTSTAMVTTKHFGDNSPVARVPVAIPWLDREDNQDNDGSSLEKNAGESEDASPQTHRKSGVTSFKNLASRVALAAKIVKSSNKTLETNKGHNDVEDHEQREEGANAKSRKGKKDKVEEKLKKKEEKQLKKIEKAKQKLARAQRELEKEKRPTKINDDDTKTIHDEHEAKVDSESTMGLSSDLVKIDLEQSGGLEEAEVASQSTKKAGKSGDSPPSKRRKSSLGKAMGRMSKILHPSPAKDKKWDELAMSEHSAFRLSVSRLQDSEETTGERILVSVTEQGSQQAQEHTEEREVDTNISISHPHDAYCDLQISGQQALQFQPALKAQVEDHDAEYGEEALKSEPKPSRPDRKPRSSRTRSEDGRSSRSEGSRSRISRSPSEVRSSATRSSTSTCSASSRRSRRSTSPSALPADATGSPSRSSQRSNTPSTVSDDAARSPSRSSSRRSKSPFTITSEADEVSSRSSRRSKSPSTLSGEAAKNRSDEDDGSTRKHSSDDGSKLRRKSRSVSPSGLQEDVSKRRRETRSASPSALRGDITKMRDANGDRRISRASRRISTARSGQLDHETLEASTAADFESRIRRASRQASSSKARTPGEAAHEGSLTIETMSPDDGPIFVTAFTGGRVRFADQHLKDVKASKFAFAESQVFEDESEHTLSDTEFETICSMPQLPKSPDRLVLYVKNAGSIIGTADATVRCPSESRTFAERLAAMSTLGRRSDESEVKRVVNPASSSETKRLKKPRASSSNELEDMLKMVGDNGSSKNDQHPRSGDNTSRVSQSTKASRASTKAPRSSGTSEQAGRKRRGSSREEESKTISSRNSDLTGKLALTTGFQGVSW
jgi:hypothetical protein